MYLNGTYAVSTHSRPKAAGANSLDSLVSDAVSTHSRPKAAGVEDLRQHGFQPSFNTQPPEGGWGLLCKMLLICLGFNTQPPEGGWRPVGVYAIRLRSFNTQPPEGGWIGRAVASCGDFAVSTHSRPKAAG